MARMNPITALLLMLCFSCIFYHGLGRPISDADTADSSDAAAVDADVQSAIQSAAGKGEDWFHWGFPHFWPHPWPFVHPPMPAGGFKWPPKQWPHWPSVHPPMPAGGFKWPPKQWPHWPSVHPPMPAGGFKWPHWPFVHPPCPWWPHHGSENVDGGAKRIDAAAGAA